MRILLCLNGSNFDGGATRSAAYLAHELSGMGHQVTLLLPKPVESGLLEELGLPYECIRSCLWSYRKDGGIRERCRLRARLAYNRFVAIPRIKSYILRGGFSLVVLNNSWMYAPALAARMAGIPYIWHIREFTEEDFPEYEILGKRDGYRLMGGANALICVSDGVFNKYRRLLPKANMTRVYNGIDPVRFDVARGEILEQPVVTMCVVGMLLPTKGQDQLIRALSVFKSMRPDVDFRLRVVGPSSESEALRHMLLVEKCGLAGQVEFVGVVEDTAPIFLSSDISFTCSRMEAFGRVTVEAMMAGCLVIGANTGGTAELIRDNVTGLLYDRKSDESLAARIVDAISDCAASRQMAKEGKREALRSYSAKRNADLIERIYQSVAAGSAGSAINTLSIVDEPNE